MYTMSICKIDNASKDKWFCSQTGHVTCTEKCIFRFVQSLCILNNQNIFIVHPFSQELQSVNPHPLTTILRLYTFFF